ncbi:exodeoxyribonuclease III [Candidatus Villigracilis saccharophilus]|uniref:exodeoxyribonuclease III n=1 Tax=Candidatus Villigracilis saccharophilus TaxID=3140684 RepID=UPI003135D80D|nr:exodeoxyribonuclease III [Anaerolineales bacterium]
MKIITWNVNGIRAALGRHALDWAFAQQPDALCLQEVKARREQLNEEQLSQLQLRDVWNAAQRPGYSGVATFYKNQPHEIVVGMGEEQFDVEGRVIQTVMAGCRLFNIYFPNGQRGQQRVDYKLAFYAQLLKLCDDLHKKGENIIITGDFNTAHMPIDLKNPKANEKTSGFLPEEREWVQAFLDHGFVDVFRHLYPDKVQYTWWTYRLNARQRGIGWRLDYYLVSKDLLPRVEDVIIHDEVPGSDHCPVELVLK